MVYREIIDFPPQWPDSSFRLDSALFVVKYGELLAIPFEFIVGIIGFDHAEGLNDVSPKLGAPLESRRSHGWEHEAVFAGFIGINLDCLEELSLGIVDLDGASIGPGGPSGMAGSVSR